MILVWKDHKGITKFEFVAKTQFYSKMNQNQAHYTGDRDYGHLTQNFPAYFP